MLFKVTKTEAMVFKSKRDKNYEFAPMQLNESQLHFCSEYKYLGHIIKDNLSDDDDIKKADKAHICERKFTHQYILYVQ